MWQALLICLVMSAITVLADTEIRNFEVPLPTPIRSIHPSTPVLDLPYTTSPHILNLSLQNTEVWIRATIQGIYKKWTARVSWPGSVSQSHLLDLTRLIEIDTYEIWYGSSALPS